MRAENQVLKAFLETREEMYSNGIFIRLVTLSYSRMVSISRHYVHPPRPIGFIPPFLSLSFFTLESFQGYLHCRCLRLAVNRESRIVLFTTKSSLKCTSMVPRSNDKSCQYWVATMHSKSRGQSHLVWEIQKKEKEERRHILWKKLSIHHFRKEKRGAASLWL